ncbi:nuclear transport factor 2 family protein [Gordonia sp. ABSL11-1]|uniref:nuclear transport factor 2 family protein n=1 Tax=Gordonia sp. ABSL11-1 TaxID=3053924 RepID=UPI0025736CBB|nr:nuclear transport factor 2 family protein [Gordonia sp. ABSL11-1]MDL9948150.1 nuclear transport factor 2 family protein [Gordonia sp. ABSL11-1]
MRHSGSETTGDNRARALQALLDKQEIYELMCRYCRGVDRLDKEMTLSCFWPGAIDVHVGRGGRLHTGTAEQFFDQEWEGFGEFTGSQHHLCNMLIEVDANRAVAETYQFSFYWAEPGDDPELNWLNSNRYHDVFERRHGEWRILRRDFLRNFSIPIEPTGFPSAENQWLRPSASREDLAYRTVAATLTEEP